MTTSVYRGPSSSTKIIATLQAGAQISVYGTKGDWSIVTVNGIPGYIVTSSIKQNIVSASNTVGRVTVSSLNIRQAASADSTLLATIPQNGIVEVNSISNWWANITYNGVTGYVHKTYLHLMNKTGTSVKDRIIVLDAGHGGTDPGAVNGSYTEKSIVLDVTKRVQALLEQAGAKVVLTRSNDTFISLSDRPTIALNNFGEMFISIHTNSFTSSSPKGTETYYNDSSSTNLQEEINLATLINNQIVNNLGMTNRGIADGNYAVTRPLDMPAILVELGFISNASDLEKLKSDYYKQLFAQSIYNGIDSYYRYK
jgi:N-acetylmuramoyl-L-alanine amidase